TLSRADSIHVISTEGGAFAAGVERPPYRLRAVKCISFSRRHFGPGPFFTLPHALLRAPPVPSPIRCHARSAHTHNHSAPHNPCASENPRTHPTSKSAASPDAPQTQTRTDQRARVPETPRSATPASA